MTSVRAGWWSLVSHGHHQARDRARLLHSSIAQIHLFPSTIAAVDALARSSTGRGPDRRSCCKVVLEPPWAMRIEDDAPLSVVAITHGDAWIVHVDSAAPVAARRRRRRDRPRPRPYVVADDPTVEPTIVIDPGGHCRTLDGQQPHRHHVARRAHVGQPRPTGPDVMLVGTYQTDGEVSRWLLDALPPVVVLRATDWDVPSSALLAAESREGGAGPAGRARPAPRPPARRRAAGGLRRRRGRPSRRGSAPAPTRSSGGCSG